MQAPLPETHVPVQTPPFTPTQSNRSRMRALLLGLLLVILTAAGAYWWYGSQSATVSNPNQPNSVSDQEGAINVVDPGKTFVNAESGIPVPVGECITGESVQLGTTGEITFKGITSLKNEPFCTMQLVATGNHGTASFDCAFKITATKTMYLDLDETGADREFIRQHCRL